jgi:hypothetical protein
MRRCLTTCIVWLGGGVYWVVWAVVLPKLGGYELVRETSFDEIDGWERSHFVKRPVGMRGTSSGVETRF